MKAKLRIGFLRAAIGGLLVLLPGLFSCAKENPQALFIYDAMAMTSQTQCQLRPGQTAQSIRPYGVLDLALTNQYWLYPRFQNMLLPLEQVTGEGPQDMQAETNTLSIQGANVFIDMGEFSPVNSDTNKVKQIASAYMIDGVHSFVAAGVEPGEEGVVAVQVIRPDLGNIFDTKMQALVKKSGVAAPAVWVTAYVTLEAQTQDRYVVHSNEFSFPIQLCWGCLVLPFFEETPQSWPCYPGQDESITCAACPIIATHPEACPTCF